MSKKTTSKIKEYACLSTEEKLKLTVYKNISKILDDVGENNTLVGKCTYSVEAKEIITELIWKKLLIYGEDLELFSQHAKRTSVIGADIKLLFRRNPKVLSAFQKHDEDSAKDATTTTTKPTKGVKRERST